MTRWVGLGAALLLSATALAQQDDQGKSNDPMMQGKGMMGMHGMNCSQMMGEARVTVENTSDGAVVRMVAKDPANVAKVQKHAQMMADCMKASSSPPKETPPPK
jgi:hypothetical protein